MSLALVTGGAGFIGSHLCEYLLGEGFAVRAVDSFSDHYERPLKELNVAGLAEQPGFELREVDLSDSDPAELFEDVDIAFHLAARPGVRDSWTSFEDYVQANIVASRAVFEAAAERGVRVVYASSSSVYGDATALPVREAQPLRPISPYGASKVMTEVLAGTYASTFGLDAVGLRYFTVYGPRQRPDMGISRFIEAISEGRGVAVYGDGQQRRDMTYVGDVVAATIAAAEHGIAGRSYNVASNDPRTLLEILAELEGVTELPLLIDYEGAKAGDVRDTWGDIALASTEIGYRPRVSLRDGLARQVEEAARRRAALPDPAGV